MATQSHQSSPERRRRRSRILFAVTGSVAAVKGPEIAVKLVNELDLDVRVLLTRGGENFWSKAKDYDPKSWDELQALLESSGETSDNDSRISMCYADDEWKEWQKLGDPVLHIDLRDWADILLVAPLSAHTLAKIAHGFCDDTVSCVIRAWDFGHGLRPAKSLLLAPAMNTAMWNHPLTAEHLSTIQGFSNTARSAGPQCIGNHGDTNALVDTNAVRIIEPQVKTLACGEIGNGALASVDDILQVVSDAMNLKHEKF